MNRYKTLISKGISSLTSAELIELNTLNYIELNKTRAKLLKAFLIVVIIATLFLGTISVAAQNDSCTGDTCLTDQGGYTYEENLADPLCWYNFNFCNAGYNYTDIGSDASGFLNVLKGANYQMQAELNKTQTSLQECEGNLTSSRISVYLLIALAVILAILDTYIYLSTK